MKKLLSIFLIIGLLVGCDTEASKAEEELDKMNDSFEQYEVTYIEEDKLFVFSSIDSELNTAIASTIIGTSSIEEWDALVGGFELISEEIEDRLGEGYAIVLENPFNPDNDILMVRDGVVLYDVMYD